MASLLTHLREQTDRMLEQLEHLVAIESPTADLDAVNTMADAVAALGREALGADPERITTDGRPNLRWRFGNAVPRIVLIGHLDTVWPLGTTARWPFVVEDGLATGPGAFDMKAGIVQGFCALATLEGLDGITIVFNSDEETGSLSSRQLIEDTARGAMAALVLEPSAAGALKTARKGVSLYDIDVQGRAAHAGLEPENGVNAVVELAHQILRAEELARSSEGTTVTPTVASAGTTINTVPAAATVHLDVRVFSLEEQQRVDGAVRALAPHHGEAKLEVRGGPNRPPFPESSSRELFARAARIAEELGLAPLRGAAVGGGSDGNFTAGIGVPTLDGLGAVGDHAHAEGEYVEVAAMGDRAALLAALVANLRQYGTTFVPYCLKFASAVSKSFQSAAPTSADWKCGSHSGPCKVSETQNTDAARTPSASATTKSAEASMSTVKTPSAR
jgi:glutamate carboxypeptidase